MTMEDEYVLIKRSDCEVIREELVSDMKTYAKGTPSYESVKNAIHTLDAGMHKCDVKPYDV